MYRAYRATYQGTYLANILCTPTAPLLCTCRAPLSFKLDNSLQEDGPSDVSIQYITLILKTLEENEHEYL